MPPLDLLAGLIDQSGSNNRDALGASYRTPVFSSYSNSMCVPGAHHTIVLAKSDLIREALCVHYVTICIHGVYAVLPLGERS